MPRKKLTPQQAKALLMADGMSFQEDFHALGSSAVQALADTAKLAGYRKSKNAPGSTARMFYQYLSRVAPVVHAPGQLTPAERRAYQARARRSHATKKSPAQLDSEINEALAEAGIPRHLKCDMTSTCTSPVTHVDEKGYVYCTPHGVQRRAYQRCRKLTPAEKKKLERGETIRY